MREIIKNLDFSVHIIKSCYYETNWISSLNNIKHFHERHSKVPNADTIVYLYISRLNKKYCWFQFDLK